MEKLVGYAMNTKPLRSYIDDHTWVKSQAKKKGWSIADEVSALVRMAKNVKYQYMYQRVSGKIASKKLKV